VILIDSSVWIDHFHERDDALFGLLSRELVLMHPYVVGEIALGHVRNRAFVIRELRKHTPCVVASEDEVLRLIEHEKLAGSGIGYVDAHLLASVRLVPGSSLWTRDKRLREISRKLGIGSTLT
jgi:predicted nucleic acid-binding protein